MGSVKDTLMEFADAVIDHFDLSDDMKVFYRVQEIIEENTLLTPDMSKYDVIEFFEKNNLVKDLK